MTANANDLSIICYINGKRYVAAEYFEFESSIESNLLHIAHGTSASLADARNCSTRHTRIFRLSLSSEVAFSTLRLRK